MFSLPGILGLLVFIFLHPQEDLTWMQSLPMLHIFFVAAVGGGILDLRLGFIKPQLAAQLPLVIAFAGWCVLSVLVKAPYALADTLREISIPIVLFLLISHCVQTFRGLAVICAGLLSITLFLAYVGVDQGLSPLTCHVADPSGEGGVSDGRPCVRPRDCHESDGAKVGASYLCEKPGLLGTHSIGLGRVRYRGILMDPNDLSLALCTSLPFAFAFFERRRTAARGVLLAVSLVLIGVCTGFSQSRGGQLVFLTALLVYFVRKFGVQGLVFGAMCAAPMLALGGRSGDEADSSALERTECLYVGLEMFRASPLFGVGQGLFTDHHRLTAHNSYILVVAELGLPGMVLFTLLLYASIKIPIAIVRMQPEDSAPVATTWGVAVFASMAAIAVGITFLSFSYHSVLWVYFGLAGALASAMRRHVPSFSLSIKWKEVGWLVVVDILFLIFIKGYTRYKGI